jgi:hypothetical protein
MLVRLAGVDGRFGSEFAPFRTDHQIDQFA